MNKLIGGTIFHILEQGPVYIVTSAALAITGFMVYFLPDIEDVQNLK